MSIKELRLGICEDADLSFSEIGYSSKDEEFWIIALSAGELDFFFRSDASLSALIEPTDKDNGSAFECMEWTVGDAKLTENKMIFSPEEVIAEQQEGENEFYECWKHDGGEGLSDMSMSEDANPFLITHDLHRFDMKYLAAHPEQLTERVSRYNELLEADTDELIRALDEDWEERLREIEEQEDQS